MKNVLIVVIILISSIVLSGCQIEQKPVEHKQIVKCNNLLFTCSDEDCGSQCGRTTSENNQMLVRSQSVNNGEGCECVFVESS